MHDICVLRGVGVGVVYFPVSFFLLLVRIFVFIFFMNFVVWLHIFPDFMDYLFSNMIRVFFEGFKITSVMVIYIQYQITDSLNYSILEMIMLFLSHKVIWSYLCDPNLWKQCVPCDGDPLHYMSKCWTSVRWRNVLCVCTESVPCIVGERWCEASHGERSSSLWNSYSTEYRAKTNNWSPTIQFWWKGQTTP